MSIVGVLDQLEEDAVAVLSPNDFIEISEAFIDSRAVPLSKNSRLKLATGQLVQNGRGIFVRTQCD